MNKSMQKLKELIYKYTEEDKAEQMIEAWTVLRHLKELRESFDSEIPNRNIGRNINDVIAERKMIYWQNTTFIKWN